MGFLDDIKKKAQDLTKGHEEQVEKGTDKASEFAKDKFGHEEQVDTATGKVKDFLGNDEQEGGEEGQQGEQGGQQPPQQ